MFSMLLVQINLILSFDFIYSLETFLLSYDNSSVQLQSSSYEVIMNKTKLWGAVGFIFKVQFVGILFALHRAFTMDDDIV